MNAYTNAYRYTDPEGDTLQFGRSATSVIATSRDHADAVSLLIRNEDAPRVALELLKAAGYADEANPLAANDAIADLNGIITELEVIANMKKSA